MNIISIKKYYLISLLIMIGITTFGIARLNLPVISLFTNNGAINFTTTYFSIFSVIFLTNKYFKINPFLVTVILIMLLSVFSGNLLSILSLILLLTASINAGLISCKIIYKNIEQNSLPIILALGFGVYGTIGSIIAHFEISNSIFYLIILFLPVILNYKTLIIFCLGFYRNINKPKIFDIKLLLIYSLSVIYAVVAFMPEMGYDALAMHLFVPGHMLHRSRWLFDVDTYVFAVMPMLTEWLYSIVYILSGEASARLLNVVFLLISAKLIVEIIEYKNKEGGALWGALFFLTTPLTFAIGSSLFIDSLLCLFVLAGVYLMLIIINDDQNKNGNLFLLGIILGLMIATKSVGFIYVSIIFIFIIFFRRLFIYNKNLNTIMLFLFIFFLIGVIPYVNAYLISGNPVFPFFNGIFKSENFTPVNFDNPLYRSGISFKTLYDLTFISEKFLESGPGAGGFTLLLLLIPSSLYLIYTKNKIALIIGLCGLLMFLLEFQFQSYLRYVFPVYAIFYAYIGISLSDLKVRSLFIYKISAFFAFLSLILNLIFINASASYKTFPVDLLFNKDLKSKYVLDSIPIRGAVEHINSLTTNEPVLVMANPMVAGLKVDALYPIWYNVKLQEKMIEAKTPEKMVQLIKDYGVKYIILDSLWEPYWAKGYWGNNSVTSLVASISVPQRTFGTVTVRTLKN